MRFDFFRRHDSDNASVGDAATEEVSAAQLPAAQERSTDGYLTYALLLDTQKRVAGYRLAWQPAAQYNAAGAAELFKAFVSCVARHLNPPKTGWRLGHTVLFFDVTAETLAASELQGLPPDNVVLCLGPDALMDADVRPILLFLREQGFRFMLCGAEALPEDPELRGLVTHFDVGTGHLDLVAKLRREEPPGEPLHLIATRIATWKDFDACAARRVDVFLDGTGMQPEKEEAGRTLQPESMLIVRLMQMIQRNEDLREIEAALKHDAALTYRLLRHMNSPAIGVGVEIHSLRHAVTMLGYSPLFRWLSLLLATSNAKASPPFLMKKAIIRGRFVELMGEGMLPSGEADNLFVVGMFSMIDQLLGVTMQEVLGKVQLSESVQQAILAREGMYGPFLALAESCDEDGVRAAQLSEALFMSTEQVNAAHLSALVWAQDVSPAEATY
ncbi:HDOD domain-containing protein [Variovorax sp. LjRoot130]|uniref:EAL and HDOD domain-containing protein n=1 Tax=Variovorax sp. LjRoot130 TaxID=3342261 RepID=UPI003ECCD361